MFNEALKASFMETVIGTHYLSQYRSIFKAIEPYEQAWNADICTKTSDEIAPIMDKVVGLRLRSKYVRLILLKKYVKWCIDEGYPGAIDGISGIDSIGYSKIKEMTVANPLHLQKIMDEVFDPEEDNTVDNTYRTYMWLAYGGLPEDMIPKVTTYDVRMDCMTIDYGGYSVPIYRESLRAISNCVELKQFVYRHPNYASEISRNRLDGDILIRGIRAIPSTSAMRSMISSKFREHKLSDCNTSRLSYNRVWLSGLFYRTKEMEDAGIPVNFEWAANEMMKGKKYNLSSGRNTIQAKKKQIMNDFLVDYDRWKTAFNL